MNSNNKITPLEWYSILCILMLVALIYSPVITNAFNGDDFVHLKWLHQAVSQPELVWRNFHSSWLDLTTAKFYRPLISIFMLADYIIWHGNGIGFHLTNLVCHLANTLLIWLILKNIISTQYKIRSFSHQIWCLSAAALFGLYPLHPEAVTWITGRVDTIVTLFCLAAFFGYIRWRQSNKYVWLFFSIISFACSLLSKEMAIVLPAVLFLYELLFGPNKALTRALKQTYLFWLILFGYIALRTYALGTLVGGYDSGFLPSNDWHLFVRLWKHSLYMLFIPFNQALLTNGNRIIIPWIILLSLDLLLCIKPLFLDKENSSQNRAIFIFLCGWLVLSLVPVYKLFNINDDLQGSRLAYLATVPLCGLICFGFASTGNSKITYRRILALATILSMAGAGLLINNCAWMKAEAASQALMQQLNSLSTTLPANSVMYIIDLPDEIDGAYTFRNALDGMTKYPQISKDINNCFNLSANDHIFPFGYALHSMINVARGEQLPRFYVWRADKQKLEELRLASKSVSPIEQSWSGENFHPEAALNNHQCINVDFVTVDCDFSNSVKSQAMRPFLLYKNELNTTEMRLSGLPLDGKGTFIFPLHNQAQWTLGGQWSDLSLVLFDPKVSFKSIAMIPANKIMPILSFKGAPNQYIVGYIELDKLNPTGKLSYDANKMVGAKNVTVELTPPNKTFDVENNPSSETPQPYKKLPGLSGTFTLNKSDFPEPGIYSLRLRAIGENNKYIGVAGDHIIVTVR